jgi:hypothetical protein
MNRPLLLIAALAACKSDPAPKGTTDTGTGVRAIVDATRPEHFLDLPFPSDGLLDGSGHPDMTGFPVAGTDLGGAVVSGWVRRIGLTTQGFANNGAAWFRFTGPLTGLGEDTTGAATDSVLLIDVETGERLPLALRFIEDPLDDPFYGENTLAMAPALGHPPRSGATLAAVVMQSAGATPAAGWSPDPVVTAALDLAGVTGPVAVATTYTVQDATGELQAVANDVLERLGDSPDWGDAVARRVASITYAQGLTPSENDATVCTVAFTDGSEELRYVAAMAEGDDHTHDLLNDWPMAVYQIEIPFLNYSGLDDRPYMRPGLGTVSDTARDSGWWSFSGGLPAMEPDIEVVSLTVSVPLGTDGAPIHDAPVVIYDHGTGGHAYNAVQRRAALDDGFGLAEIFADTGWAIVSRDSPLYGTRYPLIDEGYGASLGFYNVVNLPAFRDNQRQAALEGLIVRRFVETGLNAALPEGSVDGTRLRRMGHSLGSVTTNLGLAADPDAYEASFLSGSGGVYSHYFLDTGLIEDLDPALIGSLFSLFGAETPDVITASAAMGAALGLTPEAWDHIDRLHPVVSAFQWTMDPSDPMAVARDIDVPTTMLIGIGDHQVPNFTSDALLVALPDATSTECSASYDYDPHWVLHREICGADALTAWLTSDFSR